MNPTFDENATFQDLLRRELIAPTEYSNILEAMEAQEMIEFITHLGDQILAGRKGGTINPDRATTLLNDLVQAFERPLESRVLVGKIRRELKEQSK